MVENTKIEWAHHTFNPWEGCTKVGPGCDHCYAERRNNRFHGGNWGPGAPRRRTSPANWGKPHRWNRQAAELGKRYRVFCASLADVFDNEVDPAWRADLFQLIRETPHLDWLLLTKRIGNVAGMLPADWGNGWPNVWLGATVVNQNEADRDIPKLLATPATLRWLSMEPLLGPVNLGPWLDRCPRSQRSDQRWAHSWKFDGDDPYIICHFCGERRDAHSGAVVGRRCTDPAPLDWVIVGGESGPNARPMNPAWARYLRNQCAGSHVPFLFKQWGEWVPLRNVETQPLNVDRMGWWIPEGFAPHQVGAIHQGQPLMYRTGKARAGRLLDGQQHDGFPASPVEDH